MISAVCLLLLTLSGLGFGAKISHSTLEKDDDIAPLGFDNGFDTQSAFDNGFDTQSAFDNGFDTQSAKSGEAATLSAEHEALDKEAAKKGWILVSYADGSPIPGLAEKRKAHNQALIVNGNNAVNGNQPFMVSLQVLSGNMAYHICGGSLWTMTRVVTAAHCLDYLQDGYPHQVALGYYQLSLGNANPGSQVIPVASGHWQSGYHEYNGFPKDVAILKLASAAVQTQTVNSIYLASTKPPSLANHQVTLTGWGKLSGGGQGADILQFVQLTVLDKATCQTYWGNKILDEHVCAIGSNSGSCQGDSGGPLMLNNVQVGIVSWGAVSCDVNMPAIYNNPGSHVSWIASFYN